ncbi:hypothetical protein JCM11641_003545 [Rhodosporidiobolus odoratus]
MSPTGPSVLVRASPVLPKLVVNPRSASLSTTPISLSRGEEVPVGQTGIIDGEFRIWETGQHSVTKKRYATSTDSRGYIPVFEYTVNSHLVMVDSETGYILITAIWKALGKAKADVVKLIESQPAVAPLVRKVRGGQLQIQGTWLPFGVALELSRRVAWEIRNDLVLLFGPSFPSTCLTPASPGFGSLVLSSLPSPISPGATITTSDDPRLTNRILTTRQKRDPKKREEAKLAAQKAQNNAKRVTGQQARVGIDFLRAAAVSSCSPSPTEVFGEEGHCRLVADNQVPWATSSSPYSSPAQSPTDLHDYRRLPLRQKYAGRTPGDTFAAYSRYPPQPSRHRFSPYPSAYSPYHPQSAPRQNSALTADSHRPRTLPAGESDLLSLHFRRSHASPTPFAAHKTYSRSSTLVAHSLSASDSTNPSLPSLKLPPIASLFPGPSPPTFTTPYLPALSSFDSSSERYLAQWSLGPATDGRRVVSNPEGGLCGGTAARRAESSLRPVSCEGLRMTAATTLLEVTVRSSEWERKARVVVVEPEGK